ncbi:single-stranded-DNA-specific exonuclease RecJ [Capnocytophaga periodontitidis]|uniref:single-stranded-DNA-specific exonuclease RecJ n=1 Tax=Capnocytophaga periodontitidis TaxID=2795027 RepID=UPI0018E18957|nr:single-stranded-DNA-specific exonuclease RecJ [Capnocytophaga periodontitidis]MBI1668410.1 single-stranded-DNA-specific exonuclease RecJ [Capnocytophaga periodontitidis]
MNYLWNFKPLPPQATVIQLQQELNISEPLAILLAQRGITTFQQAKDFFRPTLSQLHNPFLMKGMKEAVERLDQALKNNETILIYGDYDVDGTSAVSLMERYLSTFTDKLFTYVPNRYTEGYGISFQGIDYAEAQACTLIIALDCGIKAIDKVQYAKEKGIDCIIADHHRPSDQVPDAVAVLDPQQADCSYPYKELCGCGLGFKLAQAYHEYLQRPFSELMPLLDLVAVATAADIVPMDGENRMLMYFGLEVINEQPSAGVKALFGEHQGAITVSDVVFKAAPRINAAGRIEHGKYAVSLLTETSPEQALQKAKQIDELNSERKELDSSIAAEALDQIECNGEQNRYTSVVFSEQWHKGVIGIVASRLIEHYYRPTIVFTKSGDKYAASARSVQGFDIYEALEQCSEHLEQFGGHKYAAGLTLLPEQYPLFKEAFETVVKQTINPELCIPKLSIDTALPLSKLTQKFYNVLKQFEPFGPCNLPPLFYAENVVDTGFAKHIGKNNEHLKLCLREVGSAPYFDAVGFSLGHKLPLITSGKPFSIVYSVEENLWNGKLSLQLQVRDIK